MRSAPPELPDWLDRGNDEWRSWAEEGAAKLAEGSGIEDEERRARQTEERRLLSSQAVHEAAVRQANREREAAEEQERVRKEVERQESRKRIADWLEVKREREEEKAWRVKRSKLAREESFREADDERFSHPVYQMASLKREERLDDNR
ncbi:MAG: hypothetical protein INR71_03225 [Terriglobus roseus]|nr:hypothetical protein [Terriglobus roseus]